MSAASPGEGGGTVVVGGGLAGLSAALAMPGAQVWEAELPGGKARSVSPLPDWSVEWGPWSFTHRAEPIFKLAEAMGVEVELLPRQARYLVVGERLRRAGPGALSWAALAELAGGLFRAPRFEPVEGRTSADLPDGASVAEVVRSTFGPALLAEAVVPMLHGIYACSPEDVDFAAAFPRLAAGFDGGASPWAAVRSLPKPARTQGIWVVRGGIGSLTRRLGEQLAVRRRRVTRLTGVPGGYELNTDEGSFFAERVLIATDATDAAALLAEVAPQAAAYAAAVRYAPLVVAHWLAPDAAFPRAFGWLAGPGLGVLGTVHASDLLPDRCPPGKRSFATMIGGAAEPGALGLEDGAIADRITDVHRRLTGKNLTIEELFVVRHPRAVAIPGRGHLRRIEALCAALPPGLAVAGAWCGAGAMPDAVEAGQRAAQQLKMGVEAGARSYVA